LVTINQAPGLGLAEPNGWPRRCRGRPYRRSPGKRKRETRCWI